MRHQVVRLSRSQLILRALSLLLRSHWSASQPASESHLCLDRQSTIDRDFRFIQGWQDPSVSVEFRSDYSYHSPLFAKPLHWRFYGDHIQVEQYPPSRCVRTKDWGWVLTSQYSVYTMPGASIEEAMRAIKASRPKPAEL
ncbi:hypothetical protein BC831DRAFT_110111 [Entophlyctis helioformis]|nr:hypothetical protein BC831DRAFT_110111 [Entophlyctis helioformis]